MTTVDRRPAGTITEPDGAPTDPRGSRLTDKKFAFILILPGLALLVAVVLYPLLRSLYSAFFKESLAFPGMTFIGLDNIIDVLQDNFLRLLNQTMIFTVGTTLLPFIIGMGLALVLNQRFRGQRFLRGAFLIPWLIPGVVVSFLWMWIFDGNYGVLNGLLEQLHIIDAPYAWLFDTTTSRSALIIAKSWNSFPWMMVMLLAGLQTVPGELHEAAAMDGAGPIRRFFAVTWPHIRGVAGLVVILEFIWNFQHFDTIFVLTGGGPAGTTQTFATEVYDLAFKGYDLGHAGALGLLWMGLLMILVVIYVRFSERGEKA